MTVKMLKNIILVFISYSLHNFQEMFPLYAEWCRFKSLIMQ